MPLRSSPFLFTARLQRVFHSSAFQQSRRAKNYYEILQVPSNATPAEVKKSFYALSKAHHPDHNPSDPDASRRFIEISEAYGVLCIPAKRHAYDREHIHVQQASHHRPRGSYSSSNSPAGGRPASGLSRRRTQFRGPPPSFYRSGGWGEHSAKRRAAQENGAHGAEKPEFGENINATGGGMGFGDAPMGHGYDNDVPHFDREGHYRTHQNQDRRRRRRRGPAEDYMPSEATGGILVNFLFVAAVISLAAFAPAMLFGRTSNTKNGEKQK